MRNSRDGRHGQQAREAYFPALFSLRSRARVVAGGATLSSVCSAGPGGAPRACVVLGCSRRGGAEPGSSSGRTAASFSTSARFREFREPPPMECGWARTCGRPAASSPSSGSRGGGPGEEPAAHARPRARRRGGLFPGSRGAPGATPGRAPRSTGAGRRAVRRISRVRGARGVRGRALPVGGARRGRAVDPEAPAVTDRAFEREVRNVIVGGLATLLFLAGTAVVVLRNTVAWGVGENLRRLTAETRAVANRLAGKPDPALALVSDALVARLLRDVNARSAALYDAQGRRVADAPFLPDAGLAPAAFAARRAASPGARRGGGLEAEVPSITVALPGATQTLRSSGTGKSIEEARRNARILSVAVPAAALVLVLLVVPFLRRLSGLDRRPHGDGKGSRRPGAAAGAGRQRRKPRPRSPRFNARIESSGSARPSWKRSAVRTAARDDLTVTAENTRALAPRGLVVVDAAGRLTQADTPARDLLGLGEGSLAGGAEAAIDALPALRAAVEAARKGSPTLSLELAIGAGRASAPARGDGRSGSRLRKLPSWVSCCSSRTARTRGVSSGSSRPAASSRPSARWRRASRTRSAMRRARFSAGRASPRRRRPGGARAPARRDPGRGRARGARHRRLPLLREARAARGRPVRPPRPRARDRRGAARLDARRPRGSRGDVRARDRRALSCGARS